MRSAKPRQQEQRTVQVVCRLTPTDHRRFQRAAERHGAGGMSGQMLVLIREWMSGLNQADLDADLAA